MSNVTPSLYDLPPAPIERVVVTPGGPPVAVFAIIGGRVIERDLVTPDGVPCDSVGMPLVADNPRKPKPKKKKPAALPARVEGVGKGEVQ